MSIWRKCARYVPLCVTRYGANALDMFCKQNSILLPLQIFSVGVFFCSTFVMALCPTVLYLAMNSKKVGFLLFFGIFLHFVLNCVLIYARIYSNLVTLCIPYTFALCYTILLQFLH